MTPQAASSACAGLLCISRRRLGCWAGQLECQLILRDRSRDGWFSLPSKNGLPCSFSEVRVGSVVASSVWSMAFSGSFVIGSVNCGEADLPHDLEE